MVESGEQSHPFRQQSHLFMAIGETLARAKDVWLVDSGCSNHMMSVRRLFQDLKESLQRTVHLGDNRELELAGVGMIVFAQVLGRLEH